jgi:hypothetical protein
VKDAGCLTSFSINSEHRLNTASGAPQSLSNGLRGDSNGGVLQEAHRRFSCLIFDYPPALASTIS